MAPKLDLKTCFRQRLRAILSSHEIKLVAQRDPELKDSTLHIDAEFALRDTSRCDSKKILHDPTNDNVFFFYFINKKNRK